MSEYTTIQIRKETKQKLDFMKSENKISYDKLITNLLEQTGGTYVEDVITVQRDSTAMSLKYWEINTPNHNNVKSYDITFQELKLEPVGTVFVANPEPDNSRDFVNCTAEIVAKRGDDVILLVKEVSCLDNCLNSISSVVHVNLF